MPKCELMHGQRIRRRLAAIIKSGPHETAGEPRAVGEDGSTIPRRCWPSSARLIVVGADVAALLVVRINAARADGAGLLGADVRLVGMFGVITVHVLADVIIPAAHFDDAVDAGKRVAFRRGVGHGPRRVELLDVILHRARDVAALRRVLHGKFLVGDAPDARRSDDCGRGGSGRPTCGDFPRRCRAGGSRP